MDVEEYGRNSNVVNNLDEDSTGRIAIQLDKLCRLLKIDSTTANDSTDVISLVHSCIHNTLQTHPRPDQILHPETILPTSTTLTDAQKAIQQNLEEALQQDFAVRRTMMLTRFEVTLESLLGDEDDMVNTATTSAAAGTTEDTTNAAIDSASEATSRVRAAVKAQLKSINRLPIVYRVSIRNSNRNSLREI